MRGLGVSEQLQVALEPPDHEQAGSTVLPPAKPQFFTHTVYHDSGIELSYSYGSQPQSTHTTPLHTLPGSTKPVSHSQSTLHTLPGSQPQSTHTTPLHTLPGSLSQSTHTTPLHRSTEPGSHSQPDLTTSLHTVPGSTKLLPIRSHGNKGHSAPHHPSSSTAFRCTYKRYLCIYVPSPLPAFCHLLGGGLDMILLSVCPSTIGLWLHTHLSQHPCHGCATLLILRGPLPLSL